MASPRALGSTAQPRVVAVRDLLRDLGDGKLSIELDRTGAPEWPEHRKRRLLDSVMRGWPIGPVYVAAGADQRRIVVDGGQRLSVLQDFVAGKLDVDGRMAPRDDLLREADGSLYGELPTGLRVAIDDYPLVVIEFGGLTASELRPALVRLNDANRLSPAQRKVVESGAFGEQVRQLVLAAADWGLTSDRIGFSNAALAYEDVIARVMLSAQCRDVRAAASDSPFSVEWFKDAHPVPETVYQEVSGALRDFLSLPALDDPAVRFAKATLVSWLLLLLHAKRRFGSTIEHYVGYLMEWFEPQRRRLAAGIELDSELPLRGALAHLPAVEVLGIFNERAAVEALTAGSVAVRDIILWLFLVGVGGVPTTAALPAPFVLALAEELSLPRARDLDLLLTQAAADREWGRWE
nr:DUF262 domain-containing protein [Micromonospora sp. NBC_00855]